MRSPPRAAEGLRSPGPGQPPSLGPWILQLLSAVSGARLPPGNAGRAVKRTRSWGETGRRAQRKGGSPLRLPRGRESQRGPSYSEGEPRPGPGAREEATWESGADRLRVRKYRLGQRVRDVVEGDKSAFLPVLPHPRITNQEAFLPWKTGKL